MDARQLDELRAELVALRRVAEAAAPAPVTAAATAEMNAPKRRGGKT